MNVLGDLLRIKKFREDKAEMALSRARAHLREEDDALHAARNALREHVLACHRKEQEMYADLCARLVLLKDLNNVALDIQLMKEETVKFEEAVTTAEERRASAAEAVEQAKAEHRDAVRMREKFTELVKIVNDEKLLEAQKAEDLELEEASSSRHSRGSATHAVETAASR